MRRCSRIVPLLALLALGWTGCKKEAVPDADTAANAGAVPPDTASVPTNPPAPAGGEAASPQHVTINNTMSHGMVVVAQVDGQTQQLGSVKPKSKGDFLFQAPSGATVQLMAHDSANTHQVTGTVVAADTVMEWTIK